MLTIGEAIRKARLERGLSRTQLANMACMSAQNIYQWEQGRFYPSVLNLVLIADVLNISLDELVGRTVQNEQRETDRS